MLVLYKMNNPVILKTVLHNIKEEKNEKENC